MPSALAPLCPCGLRGHEEGVIAEESQNTVIYCRLLTSLIRELPLMCAPSSNSKITICSFRSHQKATADWTGLDRMLIVCSVSEVSGSWMTSPRQYYPSSAC
ncbi:unnamed protein product [Leuciscus chuanchicus]